MREALPVPGANPPARFREFSHRMPASIGGVANEISPVVIRVLTDGAVRRFRRK